MSQLTNNDPLSSQQSQRSDPSTSFPRDAKLISLILQAQGVEDIDPKVVHLLLDFAHRYSVDVLQDALAYSEHAEKSKLDVDDVRLAVQGRVNHSFTTPPPKEFLLELAEEKNRTPLPLIPERYGIRLPPERHCLTAINYNLVPEAPPPPKPIIPNSSNAPLSLSTSSINDNTAAPSQFSNATPNTQQNPHNMPTSSPDFLPSILPSSNGPSKRMRDEDDDYDD
ncbi:uncharacterized protein VTP21DRAFT_1783 [Calcarisporiella thermophila]|uniref:uncharacterized protein n=1 Tax=Calcarisporiella thermophila TaxID=911321 RepID=UPI0037423F19